MKALIEEPVRWVQGPVRWVVEASELAGCSAGDPCRCVSRDQVRRLSKYVISPRSTSLDSCSPSASMGCGLTQQQQALAGPCAMGPDVAPDDWVSHVGPNGREFWHHTALGPPPWGSPGSRLTSSTRRVPSTSSDASTQLLLPGVATAKAASLAEGPSSDRAGPAGEAVAERSVATTAAVAEASGADADAGAGMGPVEAQLPTTAKRAPLPATPSTPLRYGYVTQLGAQAKVVYQQPVLAAKASFQKVTEEFDGLKTMFDRAVEAQFAPHPVGPAQVVFLQPTAARLPAHQSFPMSEALTSSRRTLTSRTSFQVIPSQCGPSSATWGQPSGSQLVIGTAGGSQVVMGAVSR